MVPAVPGTHLLTAYVAIVYGGAILAEDTKLPLQSAPPIAGLMLIVKADDGTNICKVGWH